MFDINALLKSLPMMGYGMAGIFAVIVVIMIIVALLNKVFPETKNNIDENTLSEK